MRRFVTYLYEYDKGNRGKNCGFVRIDVREGEVQMEVHLRNCLRCGEKGTVYVLVEDEEQILGIEVGEIAVSNGRGERTLQFKEHNIEESNYKFDEIIGIGIRCEKGGYLASNWEDEDYEALTWGNFNVVYLSTNSQDVSPMPILSEQEVPINLPMSSWTESSEDEIQNHPSPTSSSEITKSMRSWEEAEHVLHASKSLFEENILQMEEQEESECLENLSVTMHSKMKKEVETMQPCSENEKDIPSDRNKVVSPWWRTQMESLLQADIIPNSKMQTVTYPQCKTLSQVDSFVQTPVEYTTAKICSYQKITVSDIRNLPSPNWYLCNNNFLLHGFFNYDYLIIKKEKVNNREKFYLGVPGVFEKQEKAMAMMFGFPYFECCSLEQLDRQEEFEQTEKPKEPKEGDFGCWYLVLNI